ncbi:MAG: LAGLIDADG family homing endonuclease [Candidatus Omnitrophica bacterium]|nr:LAGLIDADG family homing endonuclease [Candidatus Omnitrophota bacterium]
MIAEFLSAIFEGDGYARIDRQGKNRKQSVYFEYSTASESLARGISNLLLRVGVKSVIRNKFKAATNTKEKIKRPYYSVYVYGHDNAKRLANILNFVGKKSEKLKLMRELDIKSNPNLDLIPEINPSLKVLVKLSGIKLKRFKKIAPKLVAYYENRCLPSRQGLSEALSIISEHGKIDGLAKSIYEYLRLSGFMIYPCKKRIILLLKI